MLLGECHVAVSVTCLGVGHPRALLLDYNSEVSPHLGPTKGGTRAHALLVPHSSHLFGSLGPTRGERQTGISPRRNVTRAALSRSKERQPP